MVGWEEEPTLFETLKKVFFFCEQGVSKRGEVERGQLVVEEPTEALGGGACWGS